MSKVRSLGAYKNDAMAMSPSDALHEALSDISKGSVKATKLFVIMLDDTDGQYVTRFVQSGMKMSEIVALMEIMKHNIITGQMEF